GSGERGLEIAIRGGIADRGKARIELTRGRRERGGVLVGADRLDAKTFALALEQVDRARANRARGTEERHRALRRRSIQCSAQNVGLHKSPDQWATARRLEPSAQQAD